MDLSVVIVNWNTKALLRDCLRSLTDNVGSWLWECIVVDNGSQDGSVQMVEREFPNVRLIANRENRGFSSANNQGITISQGDFVAVVNSDVVFPPDSMTAMMKYLKDHPDVGLLGPRLCYSDGRLQYSIKRTPSVFSQFLGAIPLPYLRRKWDINILKVNESEVPVQVEVLAGAFWLIRGKALKEVGLLDENFFFYCEDIDYCLRFKKKGWRVEFFPEAWVFHHEGGSSSRDPVRYHVELYKARAAYWKKHGNALSRRIVYACWFLHEGIRAGFLTLWKALGGHVQEDRLAKSKRGLVWLLTGK